jgi:hypothetical protein
MERALFAVSAELTETWRGVTVWRASPGGFRHILTRRHPCGHRHPHQADFAGVRGHGALVGRSDPKRAELGKSKTCCG